MQEIDTIYCGNVIRSFEDKRNAILHLKGYLYSLNEFIKYLPKSITNIPLYIRKWTKYYYPNTIEIGNIEEVKLDNNLYKMIIDVAGKCDDDGFEYAKTIESDTYLISPNFEESIAKVYKECDNDSLLLHKEEYSIKYQGKKKKQIQDILKTLTKQIGILPDKGNKNMKGVIKLLETEVLPKFRFLNIDEVYQHVGINIEIPKIDFKHRLFIKRDGKKIDNSDLKLELLRLHEKLKMETIYLDD